MAVTRTAKGTAQSKTAGTTLTIANVAMSANSLLVVAIAYDDVSMTSVTWGSQQLTLGASSLGAGVRTRYAWGWVTAASTQTITATWSASLTAKAMTATQFASSISGHTATEFAVANLTGTGASASTGDITTAASGDQITFGVVGTEGPSGDTAGTWVRPATAGQRIGTTGNPANSNVTVSDAYNVAPGSVTNGLSKTGMTSRDWGAVYANFKWGLPITVVEGSFTADAIIKKESSATFTADAVLTGGGGGGGGAIAFVQQVASYNDGGTASTSHVVPITSAPTTGNHLVMGVVNPGNIATVSATDSAGNVWTAREKRNSGTTLTLTLLECYVANPLTTSDTITVSLSSSQGAGVTVNEYSGGDPAGWYISSAAGDSGGVGATTYDSTAAPTAGAAGDLKVGLLAMSATSAGITQNESNFTARSTVASVTFVRTLYPFDGILASSSENQFSGSYTTTRQNSAVIGLFKAAAAGGGTVSGSFTANAILRKIVSGSFTADSVLLKTTSATFTADAVLTKVTSATLTADAILRGTSTGSLTANAILKGVVSSSFTADSVLRKTVSATFTADASLSANPVGTFTADAIIRGTTAGTFTADAVLRVTASGTFTADAAFRGTTAATFTADAVIRGTSTGTFTADAVISAAGGDGVITVGSGTRTENGENVSTLSVSSMPTHASGDRLVVVAGWKNGPLRTHTTPSGWTQVDVVDDGSGVRLAVFTKVAASSSETFSMALSGSAQWSEVQAWRLSASNVGTPASLYDSTSDASYEVPGLTFSTDGTGQVLTAVMTSRGDRGIYALTGTDTSLRGGGEHHSWAPYFALSTMWDAFTGTNPAATTGSINNGPDVTLAIRVGFKGGVVSTTYSGSLTADAILRKTESATFTADSVLRKTASATFTSDAVLKKTTSATWTADSILRRTESSTFTADAVLRKAVESSFTANAVLRRVESATIIADAIVKATRTSIPYSERVLRLSPIAYWRLGDGEPSPTNLLAAKNPSFEDASLTDWYNAGMGNTFVRDNSTAQDGTWSIALQRGAGTGAGNLRILSNPAIAATAGVRYTVRAWRKSGTSRLAVPIIAFYNSSGANVGDTGVGTGNGLLADGSGNWIEQTASGVAPATATGLRAGVYFVDNVPEGEVHYADNVRVFVTPTVTESVAGYPSYRRGLIPSIAGGLASDSDTAMDFPGTPASFIEVPSVSAFNPDYVSIVGWFKLDPSANATGTMLRRGGSGYSYWIRFANSGKQVEARIYTAAGVFAGGQYGVNLNDDQWHFAAMTWDGTTFRLYVDGVETNISTATSGVLYHEGGNTAIGIGSHSAGTSEMMNGGLDEVALFGYALSPADIASLYDAGFTSPNLDISADSVLRKEFGGTFTSDAILRKVIASSFTADAFLKAVVSGSFTANAVLFKTTASTFTADAYLQSAVSGTFTANAVLFKSTSATFTSDATLRRVEAFTFTGNAVLRRVESGSFTSDALLRAISSGAFTADAYMVSRVSSSFTANAVLRTTVASSYTADAYIRRTETFSATANAVLKKTLSAAFTADAVLRSTGIGSLTADAVLRRIVSVTPTADAILRRTESGTFSSSAILRVVVASSLTADAMLRTIGSGNWSADAAIRKAVADAFTADASLRRIESFTFAANAVIKKTQDSSFTADSYLVNLVIGEYNFSADAILRRVESFTLTADAYMVSRVSGSFTANAILRSSPSNSASADAILLVASESTFTANAVLRGSTALTVDSNAVLRKESGGSYTANATLRTIVPGSFVAGAVLHKSQTGTFTADAITRLNVSFGGGVFIADAVLKSVNTQTFTANAILRNIRPDIFTADAWLRRVEAGSFTADSHIVQRTESAFAANAVIRRVETDSFTADAFIVGTYTGEYVVSVAIEETLQVSVESFPTMVISTSESPTMEIDTEIDRTVGIEVTVERTL